MKIVTLVDNVAKNENFLSKHGLCFYIETEHHKILFDLGPDDTFLYNARQYDIDLNAVDTVIISHGHADHGGGLETFLQLNQKAKVYIHPNAFVPHFSKVVKIPVYCGLDAKFQTYKQIVFTGERYVIDKNLILFADVEGNRCVPTINSNLLQKKGKQRIADDFKHEQSLIIQENGKVILVGGCAHRGIINIMKQACFITGKYIDYVISGFHLTDATGKKRESKEFLDKLVYNLKKYSCQYYTCHCAGMSAYNYLSAQVGQSLHYLKAGDVLNIE